MIDTQTIGYYGMISCVGLMIGMLFLERFLMRKQIKALKELLDAYRAEKSITDRLVTVLRTTNLEYSNTLRQLGFIKEEEKPKLDG